MHIKITILKTLHKHDIVYINQQKEKSKTLKRFPSLPKT